MATLSEILSYGIPAGFDLLDYFQRRSAINSGTGALTGSLTDADKLITDASSRVSGINSDVYGEQKEVLAPYRETGEAGRLQLMDLLESGDLTRPFTGADLEQDPGYQFQLDEARKEISRRAAAQGDYHSGATSQELLDRASGLAASRFNEAFTRDLATKQQRLGALSQITGIGQEAARETIGAGSEFGAREVVNAGNTGTALAQIRASIGEALASGDFSRAAELSQLLGGAQENPTASNLIRTGIGALTGALGGSTAAGAGATVTPIGGVPVSIPGVGGPLPGPGGGIASFLSSTAGTALLGGATAAGMTALASALAGRGVTKPVSSGAEGLDQLELLRNSIQFIQQETGLSAEQVRAIIKPMGWDELADYVRNL